MGMGMPKAHRSIQPTFPFSFLNIFITVLFLAAKRGFRRLQPLTRLHWWSVRPSLLSVARPLRRTFLIAQDRASRTMNYPYRLTTRQGMMDVYLYWERSPHRSKKYRVLQIAQRSPLRA